MNASINKNHSLVTRLLIALVVAFALLVTPLGTSQANAKSIKATGSKFTRAGRVINSKLWYGGIGLQNCTYSIKAVKVQKAKKAGYKTATILFEVRRKWNPTNSQMKSMINYGDDGSLEDGYRWAFVVDGRTGENLEVKRIAKKYGITVKTGGWKFFNYQKYAVTDSHWVSIPKVYRIKYVVTYPSSYKNLCVGLGVGQRKYSDVAMRRFETGKVTYGGSWWYWHNKSSTHFLNVR